MDIERGWSSAHTICMGSLLNSRKDQGKEAPTEAVNCSLPCVHLILAKQKERRHEAIVHVLKALTWYPGRANTGLPRGLLLSGPLYACKCNMNVINLQAISI